MNRRTLAVVAGFALAGSGLYALILMLVGVRLSYLVWIDAGGGMLGFVIRLLMIMGGATLIVLGVTDWDRERAEIEQAQQQRRNQPARIGDS